MELVELTDSRKKGQRGEYLARDILKKHTNLDWQRVPSSGAHPWQKGDLFVPNRENLYCVEVKNYENAAISENILTQTKSNTFLIWWKKTVEQATHMKMKPILLFKHNRSKFFAAIDWKPQNSNFLHVYWVDAYVLLVEDLLTQEEIDFVTKLRTEK